VVHVLRSKFVVDFELQRCDQVLVHHKSFTYVCESSGHRSCVNYFLVWDASLNVSFNVIEQSSNLSDHLPIVDFCKRNSVPEVLKLGQVFHDGIPKQFHILRVLDHWFSLRGK
jgi:hypothetical protein